MLDEPNKGKQKFFLQPQEDGENISKHAAGSHQILPYDRGEIVKKPKLYNIKQLE